MIVRSELSLISARVILGRRKRFALMHPVPVAHEKKACVVCVATLLLPRLAPDLTSNSNCVDTTPLRRCVVALEIMSYQHRCFVESDERENTFTRQPMLKMWDADTDKPSFSCRHFVAGFHGRHPRPLAVLLGIWSTSVPLCTPGPRDDIQRIYHLIRMRIFFDTFSLFYPSLCYYVNFWQQWVEEYWST